ncbi:methyl-accepting chemotaxis protein [Williamwhitmania taraxaci]|uniref:Methyl-accepting chemotaxis protein n=1 Tax=Williamwhitmania taraxaci TaxID=1640674 RepID=A0A1G6QRG9_9BACT|nr:methyl-accepting chemotaxis protein [Williamwhitmania taraxaci]SDC94950.1 methyl-accepting chemotaxis protein [Williamwhitmania taraxaci]
MKQKSIVKKFAWTIGTLTSILIIGLIAYTAITNLQLMGEGVKQYVMEVNKVQSGKIGAELDKTLLQVKNLAEVFEVKQSDRDWAIKVLEQSFQKNSDLQSLSIIWESNGFDGNDAVNKGKIGSDSEGRFIPMVSQAGITTNNIFENTEFNDCYITTKSKQSSTVSNPKEINGNLIVSLASPILRSGKLVGVVCANLQLKKIQTILEGTDVFRGVGEISVISNNGFIVANSKHPNLIGKSLKEVVPDYDLHMGYLHNGTQIMWDDGTNGFIVSPIIIGNTDEPWQIFIIGPVAALMQDALHQLKVQVIIGLILIILMIGVVIVVVKRSFQPLLNLNEASVLIAKGDLSKRVQVHSKDEIGQLASTFNEMAERLSEVIGAIAENSFSINSASQELTSISQQLSQGASEQASSTEEISSSIEEMAANIQQNTDNAHHTEKMSKQVEEDMEKVIEASKKSMESVKEIAESIEVISEIAFQTNILALNAAVEAARAGESGRGFAVVAAEVRKLAERSRVVATKVNTLSKKSLDDTQRAQSLLNTTMPNITNTSRLIQEIAASSYEQNTGAEQINSAIQQLNQITQQNAAVAESVSSSAEELVSKVNLLEDAISYFNLGK